MDRFAKWAPIGIVVAGVVLFGSYGIEAFRSTTDVLSTEARRDGRETEAFLDCVERSSASSMEVTDERGVT